VTAAHNGERFVLAVDLGTGGPKVGLVSFSGVVAWAEHLPVTTRLLPGGGAVQDAEAWWQLVAGAARRALASGVVEPGQVAAVSCTGQWASTVPVDDSGTAVGPCVLWLDSRGGRYVRRAVGGVVAGYRPRAIARWVRRTGGAPSLSGADPIGHIAFLERERPEVAAAAHWYLEPVDYLSMRFCGVAAASRASMAGAWLTDNRPSHLNASVYDGGLARMVGVPLDKLAPLVPTCSVVGAVSPAVARELGIGDGVPVVAGTPDLHSAAAGSGAVHDFAAHLTLSTTSWISCPVPFKRTDAVRQVASVPGLSEDRYLVADNHETGGRALEFARDVLFGAQGDGDSVPSYEELTALAATAPAGSGGALFTPWLAGERSPVDDRRARGGWHNLSLTSSRADLLRAVLEGVAYNSRWLHDAVERFCKRRLDPIRVVGGGAGSELWCQIHADVMGRTIERVADPLHANLRGATLLAAMSLGHVDPSEVRGLVPVASVHEPDARWRELHDERYREFVALYKAQKPIFARLNRQR
jgi:xylulokinase